MRRAVPAHAFGVLQINDGLFVLRSAGRLLFDKRTDVVHVPANNAQDERCFQVVYALSGAQPPAVVRVQLLANSTLEALQLVRWGWSSVPPPSFKDFPAIKGAHTPPSMGLWQARRPKARTGSVLAPELFARVTLQARALHSMLCPGPQLTGVGVCVTQKEMMQLLDHVSPLVLVFPCYLLPSMLRVDRPTRLVRVAGPKDKLLLYNAIREGHQSSVWHPCFMDNATRKLLEQQDDARDWIVLPRFTDLLCFELTLACPLPSARIQEALLSGLQLAWKLRNPLAVGTTACAAQASVCSPATHPSPTE